MDAKQQYEYDSKLKELQQDLPFLLKVLERLRNNNLNDPARQIQLEKMQKLYDLINDKTQILKWETLLKCETVVKKLQKKMEQQTEFTFSKNGRGTPTEQKVFTETPPHVINIDEIPVPESPPPQQDSDIEILPVVIPTERRCSPPPQCDKKTAGNEINMQEQRKNHNHSHQQQKHYHQFQSHSHHHHQHQQKHLQDQYTRRNSPTSSTSNVYDYQHLKDHQRRYELSDRQSQLNNIPFQTNNLNEREKKSALDVGQRRETKTTHTQNNTQRQSENTDVIYSPEDAWDSFEIDEQEKNLVNKSSSVHGRWDQQETQKSRNIFLRLGEKVSDTVNSKCYETLQIKIQNNKCKKSTSTVNDSLSLSPTKNIITSPINADLLKSPPLTAKDITELLIENNNSNSNSNSNPFGFGLKKQNVKSNNSTSTPTSEQSTFDLIRKKFALLTKGNSSPTETSLSSSKSSTTSSPTAAFTNDRIALKYKPHQRTTTSTTTALPSNNSNDLPTNLSNVNVLPTLRPNDPRLRHSKSILDNSFSLFQQPLLPNFTPMQSKQIPTIVSNQIITPAPIPVSVQATGQAIEVIGSANKSTFTPLPFVNTGLMSTKPNLISVPLTDLPLPAAQAVSISTKTSIPSTDTAKITAKILPTNQTKNIPNDPRLKRVASNLPTYSSLFKIVDSSDENWDSDDNACDLGVTRALSTSTKSLPHSVNNERDLHERSGKHDSISNSSMQRTNTTTNLFMQQKRDSISTKYQREPSTYAFGSSPNMDRAKNSMECTTNVRSLNKSSDFNRERSQQSMERSLQRNDSSPHAISSLPPRRKSMCWESQTNQTNRFKSSNFNANIDSSQNLERFNAKSNDAREREKPKSDTPRTYGAYREAKALAEAEARKKLDSIEKQKKKPENEPISNTTMPVPIANTSLDNLYRSTDFTTCNLPKANIASFKIPKKSTVSSTTTITTNPEKTNNNKDKEKFEQFEPQQQKPIDKNTSKLHKPKEQYSSKKEEAKKQTSKKGNEINKKSIENSKKVADTVTMKNSETETTTTTSATNNKATSIKTTKSTEENVEKNNEEKTINTKKDTVIDNKTLVSKPQRACFKVKTKLQPKLEEGKKDNTDNINSIKDASVVNQAIQEKLIEEKDENNDELNKSTKEINVSNKVKTLEETHDNNEHKAACVLNSLKNSGTKNIVEVIAANVAEKETKENLEKEKSKIKSSQKMFDDLLPQPRRILKRRCTMIEKSSEPEVDKEKLLNANSMLFEDLQEQERKNKVKAAALKSNNTNRRFTGEICYEKTDDNCQLSTQNILTGKRRTRTTANFNEVLHSIAVFKHKTIKSVEEKKSEDGTKKSTPKSKLKPAESDKKFDEITKEVAKTQKATTPKQIRKRRQTLIDEQTKTIAEPACEEDGEDEEDGEPLSKLKKKNELEKHNDDAVLPNVTNIFDSFIQKILDPETDAEELINKLRDILNENEVQTLLNVRAAMVKKQQTVSDEKPQSSQAQKIAASTSKKSIKVEAKTTKLIEANKNNQEKREHERKEESIEQGENEENEEKKSKQDKPKELATLSATTTTTTTSNAKGKHHKTELDRLHEDIRDMFISSGVLTATGKRMCTFVKPTDKSKPEDNEMMKTNETDNAKSNFEDSAITKPKPITRKGTRNSSTAETKSMPTKNISRRSLRAQQQSIALPKQQTKEVSDISITDNSLNSEITTTNTTTATNSDSSESMIAMRTMPKLKLAKPIRLPEEDKLEELLSKTTTKTNKETTKAKVITTKTAKTTTTVKKRNIKPCPKSKKPTITSDLTDESDDSYTADELPIKIKQELLDISVPYEIENQIEKFKEFPKNINPKWHCLSRYAHFCVICKQKVPFISMHYKKCHQQHYASRLAPTVLHQYKAHNLMYSKPILKISIKKVWNWLHRCPFCLQYKRTVFASWVEHFISHTGEYIYECTLCHHSCNKLNLIEKHMKERCMSMGGRYLHNDDIRTSAKSTKITAHICHLCNFLRLGRAGLEQHYIEQHGYNVKEIKDLGYLVTLMNCENVPVVETLEEAIEVEEKLSSQFDGQFVDLSDEVENNEEEISIEICKKNEKHKVFKKITEVQTETKNIALEKNLSRSDSKAKNIVKTQENIDTTKTNEKNDKILINNTKTQTTTEIFPAFENVEIIETAIINQINSKSNNKVVVAATNETHSKPEVSNESVNNISTTSRVSISNVFMSTTDDSNDEETATTTLFAKKLFNTVDDEAGNKNSKDLNKSPTSSISMAERLSQRLKDAGNSMSPNKMQQQTKETAATTYVTKSLTETSALPINSQNNTQIQTANNETISITPSSSLLTQSKTTEMATETNESDTIEFIGDEDDEENDGWEDIEIEIVNSAPSSNSANASNHSAKELKSHKNTVNSLQKFSRLMHPLVAKSRKKPNRSLKSLMTLLSDNNAIENNVKKTVNTEKNENVLQTTSAAATVVGSSVETAKTTSTSTISESIKKTAVTNNTTSSLKTSLTQDTTITPKSTTTLATGVMTITPKIVTTPSTDLALTQKTSTRKTITTNSESSENASNVVTTTNSATATAKTSATTIFSATGSTNRDRPGINPGQSLPHHGNVEPSINIRGGEGRGETIATTTISTATTQFNSQTATTTTSATNLATQVTTSITSTKPTTTSTTTTATVGIPSFVTTNLADILPDSSSNDPIELAPELTPSSPLPDLNDITSYFADNLHGIIDIDVEAPSNSICIHNIDNRETSIQDALDFVSSQTESYEMSIPGSNLTMIATPIPMNRIQNIGFNLKKSNDELITNETNSTTISSTYKFYCLSNRCTFLFSSESIGLKNHFAFEHPQAKWNGYCNTCNSQVKFVTAETEFSYLDELEHLLQVHIKNNKEQPLITKEFQSIDEDSNREQPRLKIRRLSGDCLSTTTANSNSSSNPEFVSGIEDSNSFSDLIRFNPRPITLRTEEETVAKTTQSKKKTNDIPIEVTCISNEEEALFKNIGNDFQITSISSGLEANEYSELLKNNYSDTTPTMPAVPKNTQNSSLQITSVVSLSGTAKDNLNAITSSSKTQQDLPVLKTLLQSENTTAETAATTNVAAPLPIITKVTSIAKVKNNQTVENSISNTMLNSQAKENSQNQLLRITNVCSLSTKQTRNSVVGSLWSQQIEQERNELAQSAVESIEVSNILANSSRWSSSKSLRPQQTTPSNDRDSPGPMIISETLPVAQATAGNFVITQTVSAQYNEDNINSNNSSKPKLGFNISISAADLNLSNSSSPITSRASTTNPVATTSIDLTVENVQQETPTKLNSFTCLERTCNFNTRHFVAMIDHVKMHDLKNDLKERNYLNCSICQHNCSSVDAYTQHIRTQHLPTATTLVTTPLTTTKPSMSSSSFNTSTDKSTNALTEKIRNILSGNQNSVGNGTNLNVTNPLISTGGEDAAFREQLHDTIKNMVTKTGVADNKLYRCVVKDCNVKLSDENYNNHVLYHLRTVGSSPNGPFLCPHCKKKFNVVGLLRTHLKEHSRHNFFCYICLETAGNTELMSQHFLVQHRNKNDLKTHELLAMENLGGARSTIYFVVNSSQLSKQNVHDFGKKLIIEWERKKAATRTHFKPSEVELVPIQAIFPRDIYCAVCQYKSKVRTNMLRHLMQHNAEDKANDATNVFGQKDATAYVGKRTFMDPINPVPCLMSNEKHFDRMTNLASSSLVPQSSNLNAPASSNASANTVLCKLRYYYVPETKRYICGVPGCQYLTISQDIFHAHLGTLHSDARQYRCALCNENLCKKTLSTERVMHHLRFHDSTIYQCEQCDYNHYMRHLVEKHTLEKHAPFARARILVFKRSEEKSLEGVRSTVTIRGKKSKELKTTNEMSAVNNIQVTAVQADNSVATTTTTATPPKLPPKCPKFICDICGHKIVTYNLAISHCNSKHNLKHPYQCGHCLNFTSTYYKNIEKHFDEAHPSEPINVNQIFHKMNVFEQAKALQEYLAKENKTMSNEMNTRPLWQRDDPNRVRQIRGIPMEDEEETEKLRKRLRLSEDYDDEDEESGNGVTKTQKLSVDSSNNLYLEQFEFGCFYCEYKTQDLQELKKTHWYKIHSTTSSCATTKPFHFLLLNRLKCAECRNFFGCHWELRKHLMLNHKKSAFFAADARSKQLACAYCDWHCANATQLQRHHHREEHQQKDIKALTAMQMVETMRLTIEDETTPPLQFLHCILCSEIFCSRAEITNHAHEKHADEIEGFSYRELKNEIVYRCAECGFASTAELLTLRHMINHYRRFQRCHFCLEPQTTFNGYMQHCYSDHRADIRNFSDIYPLNEIRKFLLQMLIIFPNGWIIDKKNLCNTPYGNEDRIKQFYAEICKTSQEPPLPRLLLGRLVARKSIEAKQQQEQEQQQQQSSSMGASGAASTAAVMQLAGNANLTQKQTLTAKKISKRRSTVAFGNDEINCLNNRQTIGAKKQKLSTHIVENRNNKTLTNIPIPPKFDEALSASSTTATSLSQTNLELKPYSFYGKRSEVEDASKIFTKIAVAGVNTRISLDKFKILVHIDAHVLLEKLDIEKFGAMKNSFATEQHITKEGEVGSSSAANIFINPYANVKKPCPASQKHRFA